MENAKEKNNNTEFLPKENMAEQGETEKLFTQEQVDELIQARLARANKSMPSKEELELFRQWKQENPAADLEALDELRKKATVAEQRLLAYERREKILKKGVPARYCDYVLFEAERNMAEGVSFEDALGGFLAQNEMLLSPQSSAWGMRQGSSERQLTGVELAFYKRNPHLKSD